MTKDDYTEPSWRLIRLMKQFQLSCQDVADLCGVTEVSVKRWRQRKDATGAVECPPYALTILKQQFKLQTLTE